MVCDDCEKKQSAVIVPDKWKDGAKNVGVQRKLNANMLLINKERKSKRFHPKCKICKVELHVPGAYCNSCAYKKGICTGCGKKVLDVKYYKQSQK